MNPALLALLGARVAAATASLAFLQHSRFDLGEGYAGGTTTFAAQNLGAAAADRTIIACLFIRHQDAVGAVTSPTVTIGGVTATIDAFHDLARSSIAIAHAVVPSGTTGDVIATWPGATAGGFAGVSLYRVTGATVAKSTSNTASTNGDPLAATIVGVAGGVIVGCADRHVVSGGQTWTNLTEDWDTNASSFVSHSGGTSTAAGSQSISVSGGTTGSQLALVAYSLT